MGAATNVDVVEMEDLLLDAPLVLLGGALVGPEDCGTREEVMGESTQ